MPYNLPSSTNSTGPVGNASYLVQAGDCIDSIAFATGHLWQTIWNHSDNASLRTCRVSRNILLPGDQLFIPPIAQKSYECATDAKHRFVRTGVPCMLRVCLLVAGQPRGNEEYRLVIDDKLTLTGISDGEGWIEVQIPPNAAQGKLTIGGDPLEPAYTLDLGGLDPITEPTGLQQRLHNLGFHCDATGRMDDATCAALSVFQQAEGQDVTGKPNRATLDKLKKRSGC